MVKRAYSKRYAQAVFELGLENNDLDTWAADLRQVSRLSQESELMVLLENANVRLADKANLLDKVLGEIRPRARNLVLLLITKGK